MWQELQGCGVQALEFLLEVFIRFSSMRPEPKFCSSSGLGPELGMQEARHGPHPRRTQHVFVDVLPLKNSRHHITVRTEQS